MEIFKKMEEHDYEQLVFCQDKSSGLKAIICIHDTTLGPALGGTRMWNYATEEEAIEAVEYMDEDDREVVRDDTKVDEWELD